MRRCVQLAALGYKISGVVALISSHGDPLLARDLFEHQQRRVPFRCSVGLQQLSICDQPIAVLDEQVSTVAQFCFLATAFTCQLSIRVGCGFVRVIGSLLAMKVNRRIAGIVWIVLSRRTFLLGSSSDW